MAKANNKGRNTKGGFVMLRYDILRSLAYRSLPPAARSVYIEVLHRYNGTNNGEIPLSCREAASFCNISDGTASRAFRALRQRGFIKVGRASSFNMKTRTATRWIITHEAIGGKIAPSNEWREWKPEAENQNTVSSKTPTVSPRTS